MIVNRTFEVTSKKQEDSRNMKDKMWTKQILYDIDGYIASILLRPSFNLSTTGPREPTKR